MMFSRKSSKSKFGFISTVSLVVLSVLLSSPAVQAMDEPDPETRAFLALSKLAERLVNMNTQPEHLEAQPEQNEDITLTLRPRGQKYEWSELLHQLHATCEKRRAIQKEKICFMIKQLTAEADQGDLHAQYKLGFAYEQGIVVDRDYTKTVPYYTLAANQGNTVAQHKLGVCYVEGRGVSQDLKQAVELFYAAAHRGNNNSLVDLVGFADQGNAPAQFLLGHMYDTGQGVGQDYNEALRYYDLAANQEHAQALFMMGDMCETGRGVGQNTMIASEYYLEAGRGSKDALERRGKLFPGG